MAFSSVGELKQTLVRMKLVDPLDLEDAVEQAGGRKADADELLGVLERRNLLTTYQAYKLRRGEHASLVLGGCKLLYRNGSGSFARVFRACSLDDGTMVGLKLLRQRWALDPEAVAQFHREAELLQPLDHPNVVPIFDVGQKDEFHYFTMEFIVGGNLSDLNKIRGMMTPIDAARCALGIAEGLGYALSHGITHRDLKRSNVLMDIEGVAKLVDFGLAAHEALMPGGAHKRAKRSLDYAALEDGSGVQPNDPRSDLYFLGGMLYEMLAGQPPYPRAKTREARQDFERMWNARPLGDVTSDLPADLVSVVERLMHLNANFRYQTPAHAATDLRAVIEHLGEESEEPGSPRDKPVDPPQRGDDGRPTVLFVEHRADQQQVLREFFGGHGFRVLLVSDLQRALNRIKASPPDCLVLMGGSIGEAVVEGFTEALLRLRERATVAIAVLAKNQHDWKQRLEETETDTARVLRHPLGLDELRHEISEALACRDQGSQHDD